ncbi:MAG: acyl-CoA desaturase [Chitinophagia bacterium]|nr:acyl-CoA desaturase [Chitinophagia bacterium]
MPVIVFFIVLWYVSLFFQTFFHHRYAAHAAFKMSRGWEKVFFIGSFLTQGSSYLSPRAYGIMHRMHHSYTDTELDPHSPSYSKNLFDMMWRTYKIYAGIYEKTMEVDPRFTKNVPDWAAFDRFASSMPVRVMWAALYLAFFIKFATSPWLYLLYPVVLVMSPVHGAVVNWFAHKYGYRNFEMKNTSVNLLGIDVLMLGESYHNNHHKFPSSANFGRKWHEIDPVYPIIKLFDAIGIIRLNKPSSIPTEW